MQKKATPEVGFAFVRIVEAGVTEGGIALAPGAADSQKVYIVESAPYWVTASGAKVEVSYRPGDQVLLRPTQVHQDPRSGQRVVNGPQVAKLPPGWPEDTYIVSLPDIIAVMR